MLPYTIRAELLDIADAAGRPYSVAEQVFQLCVDASDHGVTFIVEDGKLRAVSHDDEPVPQYLLDAANAVHDDMVELCEKIALVGLKLTGRYASRAR